MRLVFACGSGTTTTVWPGGSGQRLAGGGIQRGVPSFRRRVRVDYFSVISTTTLFEFMIVTKIWKENNRRIAIDWWHGK